MAYTTCAISTTRNLTERRRNVGWKKRTRKFPPCPPLSRRILRAFEGQDDREITAEEFMDEMRRIESKIRTDEEVGDSEGENIERIKIEEGNDEEKDQVRVILDTLDLLQEKRDMTYNEVRLTLLIEDPRDAERRKEMGIEVSSGVSREDICNALEQVKEGYIPNDRIALQVLSMEMGNWPFLDDAAEDDEEEGLYKGDEDEVLAERGLAGVSRAAEERGVPEWVPDWVGYGFLYGLSGVPVLIVVTVVIVLFVNSLR